MKLSIALFLFALLTSCASIAQKSNYYVLNYNEFGPQAMAYEIIGKQWWQWESHGDSRLKKYDIKVVVYRGVELGMVKKKFPVSKLNHKDYRYVELDRVSDYLRKNIEDNVFESLTAKLISTKEKLKSYFYRE